jgi:hypothetical protein
MPVTYLDLKSSTLLAVGAPPLRKLAKLPRSLVVGFRTEMPMRWEEDGKRID